MVCCGCSTDTSNDSSNDIGSISYVELNLTNQTEKLTSIEYSKSTTHKCKYLKDSVYSFDFRDVEGISSYFNEKSGEGYQKYHSAKFKDIKLYFPLKNITINDSTITAQIYQTFDYSNYSENSAHTNLTPSDTCYSLVVAGLVVYPPNSKEWIHFPEYPKDNCYSSFPATIDVSITNYKSSSCEISFKIHES